MKSISSRRMYVERHGLNRDADLTGAKGFDAPRELGQILDGDL